MALRTLVIRRDGAAAHPRDVEALLKRLAAEPGVEHVRIDALPFRVSLRLVEGVADEPALRAIVRHGIDVVAADRAPSGYAGFSLASILPKVLRSLHLAASQTPAA